MRGEISLDQSEELQRLMPGVTACWWRRSGTVVTRNKVYKGGTSTLEMNMF